VTTVDHYFDTLGGISRAMRRARGGLASAVYIGDQTRGDGTARSIAEQVALETRTRALNPKWYERLLKHGFEGVREIEAQERQYWTPDAAVLARLRRLCRRPDGEAAEGASSAGRHRRGDLRRAGRRGLRRVRRIFAACRRRADCRGA
jgi:cobalamin biosynthesis Mg chelatase CobN